MESPDPLAQLEPSVQYFLKGLVDAGVSGRLTTPDTKSWELARTRFGADIDDTNPDNWGIVTQSEWVIFGPAIPEEGLPPGVYSGNQRQEQFNRFAFALTSMGFAVEASREDANFGNPGGYHMFGYRSGKGGIKVDVMLLNRTDPSRIVSQSLAGVAAYPDWQDAESSEHWDAVELVVSVSDCVYMPTGHGMKPLGPPIANTAGIEIRIGSDYGIEERMRRDEWTFDGNAWQAGSITLDFPAWARAVPRTDPPREGRSV